MIVMSIASLTVDRRRQRPWNGRPWNGRVWAWVFAGIGWLNLSQAHGQQWAPVPNRAVEASAHPAAWMSQEQPPVGSQVSRPPVSRPPVSRPEPRSGPPVGRLVPTTNAGYRRPPQRLEPGLEPGLAPGAALAGQGIHGIEVYDPQIVAPQAHGAEAFGQELLGPELYGPELYGPELYGPEAYGPEIYGSEAYGPEMYGPEMYGLEYGYETYADGALFPRRPYWLPRLAERLTWRPLFPRRPYLRGAWSGGPPLEQPRTFWLNPFALQQGVGNFLFRGNQPADTGSLGFPFSAVPSHLVDRVPRPYLGHGQGYIGPRHIDRGQPLVGTSWTNRPFFVDGYTGALLGWNLNDALGQGHGTVTGVRLGWDFEHFWGAQFGFGFGNTQTDPLGNDISLRLADLSVLYYPWGDSRWRPYTGMGLGVGQYDFIDQNQIRINQIAVQIPLSIGVKYAFKPWWAFRVDATNYLSLPTGDLNFINQLALTLAVELRFGGQRRSYFPYSPSIQLR